MVSQSVNAVLEFIKKRFTPTFFSLKNYTRGQKLKSLAYLASKKVIFPYDNIPKDFCFHCISLSLCDTIHFCQKEQTS